MSRIGRRAKKSFPRRTPSDTSTTLAGGDAGEPENEKRRRTFIT